MPFEKFCELSKTFYSNTESCKRCHKNTASHFIIDGMCKECYIKTHQKEISSVSMAPSQGMKAFLMVMLIGGLLAILTQNVSPIAEWDRPVSIGGGNTYYTNNTNVTIIYNYTLINMTEYNYTLINLTNETFWNRTNLTHQMTQKYFADDINTTGNIFPYKDRNETLGLGTSPSLVTSALPSSFVRFNGMFSKFFTTGITDGSDISVIGHYVSRSMTDSSGLSYLVSPDFASIGIYNESSPFRLPQIYSQLPYYRDATYISGGNMPTLNVNVDEYYVKVKMNDTNGSAINSDLHYAFYYEREQSRNTFKSNGSREEAGIMSTGIYENRFGGYAPTTLSLAGQPDTIVIKFPYTLPSVNYQMQMTGWYCAWFDADFRKKYDVYEDVSNRDALGKTTTGYTSYPKYTAYLSATNVYFGSWNNYNVMALVLGGNPCMIDTQNTEWWVTMYK